MSNQNSYDLLKRLVNTFRHCGWVNGLKPEQYDLLNQADEFINQIDGSLDRREAQAKEAKILLANGKSLRQTAKILGYKGPQSVKQLLIPLKRKSINPS